MGKINVMAKWDIKEGKWTIPTKEQYGRSFAIANYESVINNPNKKIDYIIIAPGFRVENCSKDYVNIAEKSLRIDNVLSHYKAHNGNYDIQLFLMDADAPIIEDAKKWLSILILYQF